MTEITGVDVRCRAMSLDVHEADAMLRILNQFRSVASC